LFHKINEALQLKENNGRPTHYIKPRDTIPGYLLANNKHTIPYAALFLKKFIFFYVMTLPFGYVFNLGYYNPSSYFHLYVLASLELIAEEIEDPLAMMLPT
jgi:putative membrane protein